jgi:hypothetical protein
LLSASSTLPAAALTPAAEAAAAQAAAMLATAGMVEAAGHFRGWLAERQRVSNCAAVQRAPSSVYAQCITISS